MCDDWVKQDLNATDLSTVYSVLLLSTFTFIYVSASTLLAMQSTVIARGISSVCPSCHKVHQLSTTDVLCAIAELFVRINYRYEVHIARQVSSVTGLYACT